MYRMENVKFFEVSRQQSQFVSPRTGVDTESYNKKIIWNLVFSTFSKLLTSTTFSEITKPFCHIPLQIRFSLSAFNDTFLPCITLECGSSIFWIFIFMYWALQVLCRSRLTFIYIATRIARGTLTNPTEGFRVVARLSSQVLGCTLIRSWSLPATSFQIF